MRQETIREHITNALEGSRDRRECRNIARWIMEDWSHLRDLYPHESGEELLQLISERLREGEPVQYILRKAPFYGRSFYVDQSVLIPRPETEELVEWICEQHSSSNTHTVLDVGTGSGCIGITLGLERPNWQVIATDVSPEALKVAQKNAALLELKNIEFEQWDLLNDSYPDTLPDPDILVSNPPYIPFGEYRRLDQNVRAFEPELALCSGEDALVFYKKLLAFASEYLSEGSHIYVECHENTSNAVMDLFKEAGLTAVHRKKDLQGKWRMAKGIL